MTLPDDYDPEPQARIWYRNALDGQLGWFVKRQGIGKIKLDRPGRDILKPFNKHDWMLCEDRRRLSSYHIGEITFEADKVLCRILGKYAEGKCDWISLSNKARADWINEGPTDEPERTKLYRTIKEIMGGISAENSRTIDPE